ncbi:hypothetical protein [Burkholderia seminalis]|uniref:hypothetical protein n=1 Tax=Burkholderia seminalis TaxID=488731 RepID=UPI00384DBEB1
MPSTTSGIRFFKRLSFRPRRGRTIRLAARTVEGGYWTVSSGGVPTTAREPPDATSPHAETDTPDAPGMQSGLQSLAVLLTALSRIPTERFGRTVFTAADALHEVGAWRRRSTNTLGLHTHRVIPTRAC